MSAGKIKDPAQVEAAAPVMAMARENCATALRERGHHDEADRFEAGERDWAWRMKHEVRRLVGEGAL